MTNEFTKFNWPDLKLVVPWSLFLVSVIVLASQVQTEARERFKINDLHREYVHGTLGAIGEALGEVRDAIESAGDGSESG